MANNLHGCLGRLNGDYPRRQLALVGAHKLVHEIFKTPLFALVPGSTRATSPRLMPYRFKNLSLQSDRSSANTTYPEDLNEIDDLYDVPSPYTLWSTSVRSVATNSDEDPSDGGSTSSSSPPGSTFDYCPSLDHDTSASTSDVEDTCLTYGPSEQDGLVVTTMDLIDLFEPEIRVAIPRPQTRSQSSQFLLANPPIIQHHEQDVHYLDIQTVLDSCLFEETPGTRVRLPGACTVNDSQAAADEDETPRIPSNASRGWGAQPSIRLQHNLTSNSFDGSHESSQQWLHQACKTEDKVDFTLQYTSTPLQHPNANIVEQHAFPPSQFSEYSYDYGYFYSEAPSLPSFCAAGTDSVYNDLRDLHNTSYAALIPAYNAYLADTTTSFQPNHTAHSQASALLSILNASSCPYTPSSLQPGNDVVVSSIGDPPIVKLAPIGHPTASPTPSSYHWPRSDSSYGSTPNSSPLSSPSTDRHVHENQVLSWPPILYERRS